MATEPLDPDVVEAAHLLGIFHGSHPMEPECVDYGDIEKRCVLCRLVALVEKVVSMKNALAKQANEMEEQAERNAVLHAEVMRERDFLLKPHNSDGTITCPECHKSMGGDGLVEALRGVMEERDLLRDKWNQMEAYGFGSPSQVFARLEAAEKAQKDAEERLKEAHVMDCSCGVVSLRGHPVDPDCAALRTRTETKA